MIEQLTTAWGNWPVFVGLAVALFVRAWQFAKPEILEVVPSRWRLLVSVVLAGLPAFSAALLLGRTWEASADAMLDAIGAALVAAGGLRMALGKAGSTPTLDPAEAAP